MEIETPSEGNGKKSTFDKDFEFDCKVDSYAWEAWDLLHPPIKLSTCKIQLHFVLTSQVEVA